VGKAARLRHSASKTRVNALVVPTTPIADPRRSLKACAIVAVRANAASVVVSLFTIQTARRVAPKMVGTAREARAHSPVEDGA
jgi:hypothetical protein